VKPTLIKGQGGVFDVRLDDRLIFSKHELGRFPAPGEIEDQLAPQLPASG
jgi:predicted Rdx family selenoprotein